MGDPISTVGSVLAVVACAAETSGVIFRFFRRIVSVPEDVSQLSKALESLQANLSRLQHCGTQLDSRCTFSPHFGRRLEECVKQLTRWEAKIKRIDARFKRTSLLGRSWKRKTARPWERIKWLMYKEHEIRRFTETMKIYQSEFSLELQILLMYYPCQKLG